MRDSHLALLVGYLDNTKYAWWGASLLSMNTYATSGIKHSRWTLYGAELYLKVRWQRNPCCPPTNNLPKSRGGTCIRQRNGLFSLPQKQSRTKPGIKSTPTRVPRFRRDVDSLSHDPTRLAACSIRAPARWLIWHLFTCVHTFSCFGGTFSCSRIASQTSRKGPRTAAQRLLQIYSIQHYPTVWYAGLRLGSSWCSAQTTYQERLPRVGNNGPLGGLKYGRNHSSCV